MEGLRNTTKNHKQYGRYLVPDFNQEPHQWNNSITATLTRSLAKRSYNVKRTQLDDSLGTQIVKELHIPAFPEQISS